MFSRPVSFDATRCRDLIPTLGRTETEDSTAILAPAVVDRNFPVYADTFFRYRRNAASFSITAPAVPALNKSKKCIRIHRKISVNNSRCEYRCAILSFSPS
jgi:hypothetical protein